MIYSPKREKKTDENKEGKRQGTVEFFPETKKRKPW